MNGTDNQNDRSKALLQEFNTAVINHAADNLGIQLDIDDYLHFLADEDGTDAEKRECLKAVSAIAIAMADIAFGVHPVQQVCGELIKSEHDPAKHESGVVDLSHTDKDIS